MTRPRSVVGVLGCGVLAAALLAGAWGLGLVRVRPWLAAGESYGVDVSHHQGPIRWDAVARDGIRQAYIKASEGASGRDDRFVENWTAARASGVRVGAYHFFSLCRPGADQARNFLDALAAAGDRAGALAPVVDLEFAGNCDGRPAASDLERELAAFLDAVEGQLGQRAMLYVLPEFEAAYPLRAYADRPRWARSIVLRPGGDWRWWQAEDAARVAGIDGGVDLDVVRG